MLNGTDNRELSAQIAKDLGELRLANGKSLSEQLTVDGFSFWKVMEPSMALYYIPSAISGVNYNTFIKRVRPYITLIKHKIFNIIKRVQTAKLNSEDLVFDTPYLFLGFSEYMYCDVLEPMNEQYLSIKGKRNLVIHDELYSKRSNSQSKATKVHSTWQYWNKGVASEAKVLKKQLYALRTELKKLLKTQEYNFDQVYSKQIINYAFHWLLHFDLPLLVDQVALAKNVIKHSKPSLLISSDVADIRARVFTLIGHQKKIPTLEIQYGSCDESSKEWRFILADQIAVWSQNSRECLLKQGVLDSQMTITGTPRNDSLIVVNPSKVRERRRQLGVSNNSILILFASTYQQKEYNSFSNPEVNTLMKKAIFNIANEMNGLTLVVKPHPLEDINETKKLIKSENNIIFANSGDDIRDLIKVCDVFVGLGTTATIDAMIADKLIVCPVFEDWIWSDWVINSKATLVARSEKELDEIFLSIINGAIDELKSKLSAAKQIFISNTVYQPDGQSSVRILELAQLISKK